jgi:3,4-dihydroxy 2-butanone 4-phosphate synthase/GTP cyclohydrolase II
MEPVVVIHGDVAGRDDVIVRVHDQCFTSEVFGSRRCDCREQLHESLKLVRKETGVVIYLQQEGRGIGLSNKVAAYSLQDNHGLDTVDANLHLGFKDELREYMAVPDILNDLGIKSIRLVTNNPFKIDQLTALGVRINGRVTLDIPTNEHNIRYIRSKRDRMQHIFPKDEELLSPPGGAGRGGLGLGLDSSGSSSDTFARFFEETAKNAGARVLTSISGGVEAPGSEEGGGMATATQAMAAHPPPLTLEERMRKGFAFGRKSVEDAIEAIRQGKIVVVVDDEDRENEGDLIMAAEKASPETIGFIVRYTSGVLCAGMEADRLDALALPPMVLNNEDPKQTAYTISVDCKHGTTTGISASDRAVTFRALADASRFRAQDFQRPGHVFPLRYKPGGVLARAGHTEASVDLSKLAGLYPAGVLAEVVNDDGSIMRLPGLKALAAEHGLVLTSVQDLIAYRCETERRQ